VVDERVDTPSPPLQCRVSPEALGQSSSPVLSLAQLLGPQGATTMEANLQLSAQLHGEGAGLALHRTSPGGAAAASQNPEGGCGLFVSSSASPGYTEFGNFAGNLPSGLMAFMEEGASVTCMHEMACFGYPGAEDLFGLQLPPRPQPSVSLAFFGGQHVMASFYGEWHPAQVRRILPDGSIEVLWSAEYSVSTLQPCDVVPMGAFPSQGPLPKAAPKAPPEPMSSPAAAQVSSEPTGVATALQDIGNGEESEDEGFVGLPSWVNVRNTFVEATIDQSEEMGRSPPRAASAPPLA